MMKSLRTAGYRIEDADMQDDARRNNGKRKPERERASAGRFSIVRR